MEISLLARLALGFWIRLVTSRESAGNKLLPSSNSCPREGCLLKSYLLDTYTPS